MATRAMIEKERGAPTFPVAGAGPTLNEDGAINQDILSIFKEKDDVSTESRNATKKPKKKRSGKGKEKEREGSEAGANIAEVEDNSSQSNNPSNIDAQGGNTVEAEGGAAIGQAGITTHEVEQTWNLLKDVIWEEEKLNNAAIYSSFKEFGAAIGFRKLFLVKIEFYIGS